MTDPLSRCGPCDHVAAHQRVAFDGTSGYCQHVIYVHVGGVIEMCPCRYDDRPASDKE